MKSEFDSLSSNDSFVNTRLMFQSNSSIGLNKMHRLNVNIDISNRNSIENDDSKTENIIFTEQNINEDENIILMKNGMDKEIYERLKNENVTFIKTLLRLKSKMVSQKTNQTPEKNNSHLIKSLNISSTENKRYKRNNNVKKFPTTIVSFNQTIRKKDNPIKVTTTLRKAFINNQKKLSSNQTNKKEIDFSKKINTFETISNKRTFNYNNQKKENSKKKTKQRTLSSIPNKNQIDKINKLITARNKRNKDNRRDNLNKFNSLSNNSTSVSNLMTEIPSVTINLFDE